MMAKITLAIHSIDNGFCRVNYTAKNDDNQTTQYCLQYEGSIHDMDMVVMYRSTPDWEPNYRIKGDKSAFEIPTGNSDIEKTVRKFLTEDSK